ncbi:MAG: hypothetical protein ABJC04_03200 [Verrucomicrobiota bacterium]
MNTISIRTIGFCVLLLALAACKPKGLNELSESAAALKTVFAVETAHVAGGNKQIVLLVPNAAQGPAATLREEFKTAFAKQGLTVVEIVPVDLGDPMQYRQFGLKAADFLAVAQKHPSVGAIVSLVGAPLWRATDLENLPTPHPPVLVVATRQIGLAPGVPGSSAALEQMLAAKIIQVAVVDGAGSSGKDDKPSKTFDRYYHFLRSNR